MSRRLKGIGEQLDPIYCSPGAKKHEKRVARKAMRRLGKKLQEDAPGKHYYRGYVS